MAEAHAAPRPALRLEDTTDLAAQDVLRLAIERHEYVGLSFSGAEDVVLVDMLAGMTLAQQARVTVFSLDTGRLHSETYQFLEKVREHYGIAIHTLSPEPELVDELVRAKGLFSFYKDGHGECCAVRKIDPLRRFLNHQQAWITGQRRDQSVTRVHVPQMQDDRAFQGRARSGPKSAEAKPLTSISASQTPTLQKYNPLAAWSSQQVWQYIRTHKVPFNSLHNRGFVSIGCEPCTRAVGPHEHERAGRWWWEEATMKECGLHGSNMESGEASA